MGLSSERYLTRGTKKSCCQPICAILVGQTQETQSKCYHRSVVRGDNWPTTTRSPSESSSPYRKKDLVHQEAQSRLRNKREGPIKMFRCHRELRKILGVLAMSSRQATQARVLSQSPLRLLRARTLHLPTRHRSKEQSYRWPHASHEGNSCIEIYYHKSRLGSTNLLMSYHC